MTLRVNVVIAARLTALGSGRRGMGFLLMADAERGNNRVGGNGDHRAGGQGRRRQQRVVALIDITKVATMHMDSAPSQIATGGTMASPTTVTFQTDKVGIRLRWPISWTLRNANAIAFMSAVTWP